MNNEIGDEYYSSPISCAVLTNFEFRGELRFDRQELRTSAGTINRYSAYRSSTAMSAMGTRGSAHTAHCRRAAWPGGSQAVNQRAHWRRATAAASATTGSAG